MITILLFFLNMFQQPDIYSFTATTIYGDTIRLSDYTGKKILLVNTASNSIYVDQFTRLEMLASLYKDSLEIIAFPSNSFGNEPWDASNIIDFLNKNYPISFTLADITSVTGSESSPLYKWLSDTTQAGSALITDDFEKFLIGNNGQIIGVFAGSVDPMDDIIQNAIKGIAD